MADAPRAPVPGDVIAGKYQVLRLIGEGGMGVVVEAEHLRLRQRVAIKVLSPDMIGNQEVVDRFEREAQAASRLQNPHVVRVTDVDVPQGSLPYIVMELLAGQDLERYRETRGALPYPEVCEYVLQACSALADAHAAGIVHRDLKPGNLFLTTTNERTFVKVLDFGISRVIQEEKKLTSAGAVMGTALYMSPEQVRGEPVDARSDVWSLGVILYELLTGDAPWSGPMTKVAASIVSEAPQDIRGRCTVPEPLALLVDRMLEKNIASRVQSIDAVIEGLAPHAPEGGLGREIAQSRARRSNRNLTAPLPSRPSLEPGQPARAQTSPEKSTMTPTTTNAPTPTRSRRVLLALSAAAFAGMLVAGVALILASRDKPPIVVADPSPPPPLASSALLPPASAPVIASSTPSADPEPPKPALAASQQGPHAKPKPTPTPPSPKPAAPTPSPPPKPKPAATNPITI